MLEDIDGITHAVKYAQKIARKMSQDPEVDSIAGEAAWRAMYTWDRTRNVKLSWWIAQLTKQSVIHYWRRLTRLRKHEKLRDELWWAEQTKQGRVALDRVPYADGDNIVLRISEEAEVELPDADWQLLVESFIMRWPLDVIARERGVSLGTARKMRNAAIARLEAAS